jgi:hypothetical protein
MESVRFVASISFTRPPEMNDLNPIILRKRFGYLKPALRWVQKQMDIGRSSFIFADVQDQEAQNPAWNIRDGLLGEYRTVKPGDCPSLRKPPGSIQLLARKDVA